MVLCRENRAREMKKNQMFHVETIKLEIDEEEPNISSGVVTDDRFTHISSEKEIKERIDSKMPINTKKQNIWAVNVWDDWAVWRNNSEKRDASVKYTVVPSMEEIVAKGVDEAELGFWLTRFVLEIKQNNGKDYTPNSVYQICTSIQRFLRTANHNVICKLEMFNENNPNFYQFYTSLDSKMKELTSKGIGTITKSASPISTEDEETLWETGTININTSSGLSHGVFFYNCKLFGMRGQNEHKDLTPEQYSISVDRDTGRKKMTFHGRLKKNNQGGIKMRKMKTKVVDQYHDPSNPRCAVTLFQRYLELIPKDGPFYRRPLVNTTFNSSPKFSKQPIGINKLSCYMKSIFNFAGISTEGRNISNHSGKVTMCTNLYNSGFDKQTVQQRSGYRSTDGVQVNKRPGSTMTESVSECLQPPKPKKKSSHTITRPLDDSDQMLNQSTSSSTPASSLQESINHLPSVLKMVKESGLKHGEVLITKEGISIKFD